MGSRAGRWIARAMVGLGTVAAALAAGDVAAAFVRPQAAPVVAVGDRFISLTPEWLKGVATRTFGTSDKTVLVAGVYVVVVLLAVPLGWLAERHPRLAAAAVAGFGALAMYAALSAPAARGSDVVPSLVATAAGVGALLWLRGQVGARETLPDRRALLLGAAGVVATLGLGELLGRAWQRSRFSAEPSRSRVRLPAPAVAAPELPAQAQLDPPTPFQTPNRDFYRIDIALRAPQIEADRWQLRIDGMVDRPTTLTYAQLLGRPLTERWITLACVSNYVGGDLISTARFLGVPLGPLLREAGVQARSTQLLTRGADGMTIGVPTSVVLDGRDAMLAVGMNGEPLPVVHGFPVRMVVPGLYGYVSACKWIDRITATTFEAGSGYWPDRGWDRQAPIQLASRIDQPRPGTKVRVGDTVVLAGIAWHQHASIGGVEVREDSGDWVAARMGPAPSPDTWRQWVLPWKVSSPGGHTYTVRAFDADGTRQVSTHRDPFPNAGSGLDFRLIVAR